MARLDPSLESAGAEFLVLEHLLTEDLQAMTYNRCSTPQQRLKPDDEVVFARTFGAGHGHGNAAYGTLFREVLRLDVSNH